MKVVRMISDEGIILNEWPKVKDAAKEIGMSQGNLSCRIQRGSIIGGVRFAWAESENVPEEWKKPRKNKRRKETPILKPNHKRGMIVHEVSYETKNGVICITDCPFKADAPRIKVGSSSCNRCHSFKKKDKEKKIVFCTFLMYGYNKSKNK